MPETSIRDLIFRSHKIFPFLHRAALLTAIDLHGKNGNLYDKTYIANLRKLGVCCHWMEECLLLVEGKFPVLVSESMIDAGRPMLRSKMLAHSWRMGYTLCIGENVYWAAVILSENEMEKYISSRRNFELGTPELGLEG
jgi:hypothetical protein